MADGYRIPMIGLGTYRTKEDKDALYKAVKFALQSGYRHIDTAWVYENEEVIGQAVKDAIAESNGELKREDLFLASKVWCTFHSKEKVRECLNASLTRLGVNYIDLYMIHWPFGFKENTPDPIPQDENGNVEFSKVHYFETYRAMEDLVRLGKIRSLGVSNFNLNQLQYVMANCTIKPVNLQVEITPYLTNEKLVKYCHEHDIVVTAYAPIGGGKEEPEGKRPPDVPYLLENETIVKIAKRYNRTPAQVCLRWGIQRGLVLLPKSVHPERILENAKVFDFELTDRDMGEIMNLNMDYRCYWMKNVITHPFHPFGECACE